MSLDYRTQIELDLIKKCLKIDEDFKSRVILEGKNSKIFEVILNNHQKFAIKFYPLPELKNDYRDRLGTETKTLNFLKSHDVLNIPEVISIDSKNLIVAYSWLDGEKISTIQKNHIDDCVEFLNQVALLSHREDQNQRFELASASCLSIQSLISQIDFRLEKLSSIKYLKLNNFINDFKNIYTKILINLNSSDADFINHEISESQRILIPADFGFHNALEFNNKLYFFDFEYFGYDDPIRLIGDILWHPELRLSLSDDLYDYYFAKLFNLCRQFYDEEILNQRLKALFPLYGLRWILISLNIFVFNADYNENHLEQLSKANTLLNKITY